MNQYIYSYDIEKLSVGDEIGYTHDFGTGDYDKWVVSKITKITQTTLKLEDGTVFSTSSCMEYGESDTPYARRLVHIGFTKSHNETVLINIMNRNMVKTAKENITKLNQAINNFNNEQLVNLNDFCDDLFEVNS